MTIRVAAIEVGHWHALHDAAYLRHLIAMPDVELVAIQDSDAGLVARRAAEVGSPPTFTDYRKMLATTRPNFVVALGRHRQMARIAHDLLDQGFPFLMEKPMGISAPEVEAVAAEAARLDAFVAVPLAQRYAPFATRARELLAARRFGPLSHIYVRINRPGPARYQAWDCAWMPISRHRVLSLGPPQFSCLKAGHGHGPRRPAETLRPALSGPPADAEPDAAAYKVL
jgi:predicted dehydrogenase